LRARDPRWLSEIRDVRACVAPRRRATVRKRHDASGEYAMMMKIHRCFATRVGREGASDGTDGRANLCDAIG
jgi:hypothetical protein